MGAQADEKEFTAEKSSPALARELITRLAFDVAQSTEQMGCFCVHHSQCMRIPRPSASWVAMTMAT